MDRQLLKSAEFTIKGRVIKPRIIKEKPLPKPTPAWMKEVIRVGMGVAIAALFWVLLQVFVNGYFSATTGGQINSIGQFTKEFQEYWNQHDHY